MKALHFGRFHNDNFGGLERHVSLLLRGLCRSMHVDNLVANERFSEDSLDAGGYRVIKVPSLGVFAGTALCPTMPWRARALHRINGYDIAHLHFPDPMSHLSALALPRGVRLAISWHSDIIRQKKLFTLYRPLLDRIVARADAIIAATPAHFSSSTQLGACRHPERLHVVPYGMDFAPYETPAAIEAGRALRAEYGGRPLIFAVGRHVYYKGFDYLVRAMQSVEREALLLLGGSGPLSPALRELAATLRVEDRIRFLGRVPDAALPACYHAADVFCLPSVEPSEAFGLVQVEAMICRKPVVCCELGNGVNYVNQHGSTGLAVPPRDPSALADAINRLLRDDRLRADMGEAGRRRAEGEFTLQHMWDGMRSVYETMLARAN